MKNLCKWYLKLFLAVAAIFCLFSFSANVFADKADDLAKDADKEIREAEKSMFGGKTDEALTHLDKASSLINSAKAENPEQKDIKRLESKTEKIKKDIERKTKNPTASKIGSAMKSLEAETKQATDKLPAGVSFRLKEIDKILSKSDRIMRDDYPGGKEAQAGALKEIAKEARSKMDEIEKNYGDQLGDKASEVDASKKKIEEVENKAKDLESESETQKKEKEKAGIEAAASSGTWIEKFKPYVTGMGQKGYDKDKYFISGYTEDKEEMVKRMNQYSELKSLYLEYKKNEPKNKTDEMADIEKQVDYALSTFDDEVKNMSNFNKQQINNKIKEAEDFLTEQESKTDPIPLDAFSITSIKQKIDNYALSVKSDDPSLAMLNEKLNTIQKRNVEIKKKKLSATKMIDEKYKGDDAKNIKSKAEEVVKEKIKDVKILKTNIISSDWNEESVIEYTDTTQSALRHRVTRRLSVQIAGKSEAGCSVYTVNIEKDKRTDGSWGELKGHIMFTDPILEENVK